MSTTSNIPWFSLIGWALIIHLGLFGLSYLEVFLYSVLINPGQEQTFYEAHAQVSAPYVAIILGIPFFYLVSRRLAGRHPGLEIPIGVWLTIMYIGLDLLILIPFQVDWTKHWWIFILSFLTKLLASYWGARSVMKAQV